jgi:FkbM family methyltransferase
MNRPQAIDELLRLVLGAGGLVMDIGAHVGEKAEGYLARGARVVCVEPLPACVDLLRQRFGNDARVAIVAGAVGAQEGRAVLSVCSRAPYLSTLSAAWKRGRFHREVWDHDVEVPVTTLDALIERHGVPAFCKIDVEGYERHVLAGLGRRLQALSIEFAREAVDETEQCLARLRSLGYTRFNLAFGQAETFSSPDWVGARDVVEMIGNSPDALAWGDVYAISGESGR